MTIPLQRALIFSALLLLSVSVDQLYAQTITVKDINAIQGKSVLNDNDMASISSYVQQQLTAMLLVTDTKELDEIKRDLNNARFSKAPTAQQVYANRFALAVKESYRREFTQAGQIADKKLATQIQLAVAIVVSETDSPELLDDFVSLLKESSAAIRYWAAKGLSGPMVYQFLMDQDTDSEQLQAVLEGLEQCLENETNVMVITAIARAASLSVHPEALDIVYDSLAKRLEAYQGWTVRQELQDLAIMRYLLEMVDSEQLAIDLDLQTELIRKAVQIYSAAYYRYSMGLQCNKEETSLALLDESSKRQLQTFLIEGERLLRLVCSRIDATVRTTPRFLAAIDSGNCGEYERAYTILLDGETGTIHRVFNIYPEEGVNPYPPLAAPPTELIEKAQTRLRIATDGIGPSD